jgi:hypothetical protein
MRYELFLRGAAALDDEAVQAAAQIVAEHGPTLSWERFQVDGVTRGLDVGADLEQPGAGALLCRAVFRIAAAQGLTVFDPQLGRAVMEGDAEQIEVQAERGRAFAEAAPLSSASGQPARLNPSTRLWLLIALLLVGALVVARALSCLAR